MAKRKTAKPRKSATRGKKARSEKASPRRRPKSTPARKPAEKQGSSAISPTLDQSEKPIAGASLGDQQSVYIGTVSLPPS